MKAFDGVGGSTPRVTRTLCTSVATERLGRTGGLPISGNPAPTFNSGEKDVAPAKKRPARKTAAKKTAAKKSTAKKGAAKKRTAKKAAKKTTARKKK